MTERSLWKIGDGNGKRKIVEEETKRKRKKAINL